MRIGLGIGATRGSEGTIDGMIRRIRQAEVNGFAAVWMSHIFGVDAITFLALAGRETRSIELGSFVVPTYPRHPVALAQAALTAAAASGNRFTLGVGLSHRIVIEDMFGLDYSKPAHHMREYLSVLEPLLRGERVQFRGEEYRVAAQLNVPGATRPPLLVAALGPRMLALAGEKADGTATWMAGPKYLAGTALPALSAAAARAGRPAPRIAAGFPIAVCGDAAAARAAAAKIFAIYGQLPSYRAVLDIEGAAGPEDVAIVGSEEQVESQIRALADTGVTDLNASLFPVEGDPEAEARTYSLLVELVRKR